MSKNEAAVGLAEDNSSQPQDGVEVSDDMSPYSAHTGKEPFHAPYKFDAAHMVEEEVVDLEQQQKPRQCPLLYKIVGLVPHGGFISNVYNLASATLGAGIVSVASGFHDSGIIISVFLLVIVCILTIYSIRLLGITMEKTRLRSYEEMAKGLFGTGWDYFTAFLMWVFCWGTCVSYAMSVGDLLTPILQDDTYYTPPFLKTTTGHRLLIALVWFVGMFSLSLPKEINSLRYASVVGVSFIIFFVICMIIHSSMNGLQEPIDSTHGKLILANTGITAVNGLTLFVYAFIVQVNVPEIYMEMAPYRKNPRNFTIDATVSMCGVAILNLLSGIFGYLDFREEVTGSILLLYKPKQDVLFLISYIGICVKLCVGFAICIQPSRDAIYYCLRWGKTCDVNRWVNYAVSGTLALLALICAFFIPNITIVFNLLGGVCGCFLAFMFPAFFFIYSGGFTYKKVGFWNFLGCFLLLVAGAVSLVFGTAAAIYAQIYG
ncbi:amino acid permease [Strigomonas culicis]|uniref:Amino acid permease n=1 Tax=Strigomonas culicis TaxID=28005 RepID=S9TWV4_9TRYP|nr:amino acid permease [Strigomonas culicis]|eukprot:EPY21054.1 amino acid permease [Strigomonas culicis]